MRGDIELHPEHGVNPFLTYCRRCGGEAPELVLVGRDDGIYECAARSAEGGPHKMVGRPRPNSSHGMCEACGFETSWTKVGTVKQGERLPSRMPCHKCEKEIEEHKNIVEAGGVYFECADCKASGVIKGTARLSTLVREQHQEDEEKARKAKGQSPVDGWFTKPIHRNGTELIYVPCGIKFKKEHCPACGPGHEIHNPPKPT